jgi:hypothetical protein
MAELSDLELLDALGVEAKPDKKTARTSLEERIIAGFEEIQGFVDEHERLPAHGEDNDIFERLYATRLDQIRRQEECRSIVQELDHQGLLEGSPQEAEVPLDEIDDNELLSELGVSAPSEGDVTQLRHVKPRAEVRAAEEIANRTRCEDFDTFKPIFEAVQKELENGIRETRRFKDDASVRKGNLFILSGQKIYVAEVGEEYYSTAQNRKDARLRAIYDNGTESDLLVTSLKRALQKDGNGRRISDPSAGPLFSGENSDEDLASGTIYVLRSKSDHLVVSESREVVHKIGVTGGSVEKRIANAKQDPTFLMADVEILATYELYNINRTKLENLIHKFFDAARLDIQIMDRFGQPVVPKEWFLVPLFAIDEVVTKIKDGTIGNYTYNVENAKLALRDEAHRGSA